MKISGSLFYSCVCQKIIAEPKKNSGKVKHELRVTSSNLRVTNSNPRVTS